MAARKNSIITDHHKEVIDANPNKTCYELAAELGVKFTVVNNYRQWLKRKERRQDTIYFQW
jgi:hypothetical protein